MRLIYLVFMFMIFSGCSQENYNAPNEGGNIYHVGGINYKLVVRTRSGDVIEHNMKLQDRDKIPKFIKSVRQIINFHSETCGFLEFIQPGHGLPSLLNPLDDFIASNSEQCPIHFGAVEDKYFFK